MGITPYAAGQFTTYSLPAYAEQVLAGAGTFALNYAAKDVTALAYRARRSHRQVVCDVERLPDPARPRRLGA
jgi:hypothetical protein